MKSFLQIFSLVVFVSACNTKPNKPEVPAANFFPVPEYIRGELKRLDSSNKQFYKVSTTESGADTISIERKELPRYATDFLKLPDISKKEVKDDYTIDHLYDDLLKAFVFTFTTKEDHPVKREDVVVEPELNSEGKNDIRSIFVDIWDSKGDTLIEKKLLWESGSGFQSTITKEVNGQQRIERIKVYWQEPN